MAPVQGSEVDERMAPNPFGLGVQNLGADLGPGRDEQANVLGTFWVT